MSMADHVAADGFKDAGYEYINIDVSDRIFNSGASAGKGCPRCSLC